MYHVAVHMNRMQRPHQSALHIGGHESELRIALGKFADLTVLSQDIMKIPEADILKTRCLMTVVNGEVIYEADDAVNPARGPAK